jgi:hypothetical protein
MALSGFPLLEPSLARARKDSAKTGINTLGAHFELLHNSNCCAHFELLHNSNCCEFGLLAKMQWAGTSDEVLPSLSRHVPSSDFGLGSSQFFDTRCI